MGGLVYSMWDDAAIVEEIKELHQAGRRRELKRLVRLYNIISESHRHNDRDRPCNREKSNTYR